MEDKNKNNAENELKLLERRVEDLLLHVEHLRDENRALRARQDNLAAERASLMQKNELARTRVEAIIGRLKTLEHNA
jgi:cell division protein ZapB